MWLKYRHKFAHGKGSWEWKCIGRERPSDASLEDYARDLVDEYSYSDKYRGVDYAAVDDVEVPRWVINREIEINDARFKSTEEYARRLDDMRLVVIECSTCKDGPIAEVPKGMWGRQKDCEACGRTNVSVELYAHQPRARQ